jgi:hypothetical protein
VTGFRHRGLVDSSGSGASRRSRAWVAAWTALAVGALVAAALVFSRISTDNEQNGANPARPTEPERTVAAVGDPVRGVRLNVRSYNRAFVMQAGLVGRMLVAPDGCVFVRARDPVGPDVDMDVVWPPGTSTRPSPDGHVAVVAPGGEPVGAIGDTVVLGGGMVAAVHATSCRTTARARVFDIEGDLPVSPEVSAVLAEQPD